jgi:tRNA(Ile2)-agmatinylcytidine synthase
LDTAQSFLSIGIDDVDTPGGGCTTHFGALLVTYLTWNQRCTLLDYPLLTRLNPGIPWKTRGNASVTLRVDGECFNTHEEALYLVSEFIEVYQGECKHRNSSPGVVVFEGNPWNQMLRQYYTRVLTDIVLLEDASRLMDKIGAIHNDGRGIIGALAGIASLAPGDPYTFELLTYRRPEYWGSERCVDFDSVREYDLLTGELTFSNIDYRKNTSIIAPHGPDPILYGVRSIKPETALLALKKINTCEPIHNWCLYRTNQATSIHEITIDTPRYYRTGKYDCTVTSTPRKITGGHVIVEAKCGNVLVDLAFYRESYPLNNIALHLIPGDKISVVGPVKQRSLSNKPTISPEVLYIGELVSVYELVNPRCPKCGSRMKSKGKGKGFECPKCGNYIRSSEKVRIPVMRRIMPGRYTPTPMHLAHIVRPNFLKLPVLDEFPVRLVDDFCGGRGFNSPVNNPFSSNGSHS